MPLSVIEFQDDTGDIIVARVPQEGTAEIVSGSQLIVQDGQIAAFFHDGRPTDGFRAGRYKLTTQNLPVLSKLLNIATLSRSPFRSYVYFVALKTFTDMGWGTASPILYRDSEFRMVNLRAHGSFAIRISDPRTFLLTIVGTKGHQTTYAIEDYLRSIIVGKLAQALPTVMSTVLDLAQKYDELAAQVRLAVHDQFDQYGLKLVDFNIEAITLPNEVQDAINRAAGSRAVGTDEVERYERISRSDALRDAAKQPGSDAGGGLAAGLGIGAGMGLAKEMANGPASGGDKPVVEDIKRKLRELKSFLEEGLITEEEYETKRKMWLDQL